MNEVKDKIGETEGIYEEANDPDKKEISPEEQDKIDDDNEENGALDIEGDEHDYEGNYERNMDKDFDDGFVENYKFDYMDYKGNSI